MQSLYIILLLSFIQGFSEFLPISSSGHLVLLEHFFKFSQGNITFDISLHFGTLLAILIFYYKDVLLIIKEIINFLKNPKSFNNSLAIKIILATIPSIIFGFLIMKFNLDVMLRLPIIVGINLIVFGIILYIVDTYCKSNKKFTEISKKNAFIIGLGQCIALIPGVSRSGITITMGRFQKVNKVDAVRFSMLISIPATIGAIVLGIWDLIKNPNTIEINSIVLGVICSFIFGIIFLKLLIKFIQKFSFSIFVIYRIIIGVIVILVIYF